MFSLGLSRCSRYSAAGRGLVFLCTQDKWMGLRVDCELKCCQALFTPMVLVYLGCYNEISQPVACKQQELLLVILEAGI